MVSYANQYVEFRIIQVGEHDGDGSAVIFMATHSLPKAQQMRQIKTNEDGWEKSYMRNTVFDEGDYVQTGLSGLKDAAKTINKVATTGSYDAANYKWEGDTTTTEDQFWLLSYSELAGKNTTPISSWYYFKNEGTQYDWCIANLSPTNPNKAIKDIDKTRAGYNPEGYTSASSGWWLRSPRTDFSDSFGSVSTEGLLYNVTYADDCLGVVPAFAM